MAAQFTDGTFPGLQALVDALPAGATICTYGPGVAYQWDETEHRYVEQPVTGIVRTWILYADGTRELLHEETITSTPSAS